jgi:inactivated superfamily I helicase
LNRFSFNEKKCASLLRLLKQDSAETFQKVLRFLQSVASKLVFLISEFRDTAHFFFIQLNFAEVQQPVSAKVSPVDVS